GRDRDRTCDPYHVKEDRAPEVAVFMGKNGTKNGGESRHVPPMFTFSGSLNLRALPRRFRPRTHLRRQLDDFFLKLHSDWKRRFGDRRAMSAL
ncbi:MAG: hypothetical protein WA730_19700, partial [Pseudolabrys sp.]